MADVTIDTPQGRFTIGVPRITFLDNQNITCPSCSPSRKKKNDKCAEIRMRDGAFHCHHCGLIGHVIDEDKVDPIQPIAIHIPFRQQKISEKWRKWLVEERKISVEVAEKMNLYTLNKTMRMDEIPEWVDPEIRSKFLGKYVPVEALAALYVYEEKLIQIQYRDMYKNFSMEKNTSSIFFNSNVILKNEVIIITEGWLDAVACAEAGLWNVISVPNGATITEKEKEIFNTTGTIEILSEPTLQYLENQWHLFDDVKEIVLCMDKDAPGQKLFELLRRRFMAANKKVSVMRLPSHGLNGEEIKDANDVLIFHSKEKLKEVYEKREFATSGELIYLDQVEDRMDRYFNEGMPPALKLGFPEFDGHFGYYNGNILVANGYPGMGKTSFNFNLMVIMAVRYGHKFLIYSPENHPEELIYIQLAEIYAGRTIDKNKERSFGDIGTTWEEAKAWAREHFIVVHGRPVPTWEMLRSYAINSGKAIRGILIDPVNRLKRSKMHTHSIISEYLQEELTEQIAFGQDTGISTIICVHPPTQDKKQRRGNDDGSFNHPTAFEAEGGKIWFSSAHVMYTVHRPQYSNMENKETEIYVQKLKDWKSYGIPTGEKNPFIFKMTSSNRRYTLNGFTPLDKESAHQMSIREFNEQNNQSSKEPYHVQHAEKLLGDSGTDNPF